MDEITNLSDDQAALKISDWVSEWDRSEPLRYARLGLMVLAVHKRLLWKFVLDPEDGLPCRSLARWIRVCAPHGYSTCYQALRDVQDLADVPAHDLAQLPQSSIKAMRGLSGGVRKRPDVLAAAKQGRDALAKHVKEQYPNQHWVDHEDIRLHVTTDQKAEILEEITAEVQAGEAATAGEVVFGWAMNARLERQTRAERVAAAEQGRVAHA